MQRVTRCVCDSVTCVCVGGCCCTGRRVGGGGRLTARGNQLVQAGWGGGRVHTRAVNVASMYIVLRRQKFHTKYQPT